MESSERRQCECRSNNPKNVKPEINEKQTAEMSLFEWPRMAIPFAFRGLAEQGAQRVKESSEKMKTVSEEMTGALSESYLTTAKGATDYGLKVIQIANVNAASALDFVGELMTTKSMPEMVQLSTAQVRKNLQGGVCTECGAVGACSEGRDRDRRADQAGRQGLEQGLTGLSGRSGRQTRFSSQKRRRIQTDAGASVCEQKQKEGGSGGNSHDSMPSDRACHSDRHEGQPRSLSMQSGVFRTYAMRGLPNQSRMVFRRGLDLRPKREG